MAKALQFGTTALEPGLSDPDRVRVRVGQRINNRGQERRILKSVGTDDPVKLANAYGRESLRPLIGVE